MYEAIFLILFLLGLVVWFMFYTGIGGPVIERVVNFIFFGQFRVSDRVNDSTQQEINPLVGAEAVVVKEFTKCGKEKWSGRVTVNGTNWNAEYNGLEKPEISSMLFVQSVDELTLQVCLHDKLTSH